MIVFVYITCITSEISVYVSRDYENIQIKKHARVTVLLMHVRNSGGIHVIFAKSSIFTKNIYTVFDLKSVIFHLLNIFLLKKENTFIKCIVIRRLGY